MGVPVRDRKVSAAALSTRRSLRPRRSRAKPGKRPKLRRRHRATPRGGAARRSAGPSRRRRHGGSQAPPALGLGERAHGPVHAPGTSRAAAPRPSAASPSPAARNRRAAPFRPAPATRQALGRAAPPPRHLTAGDAPGAGLPRAVARRPLLSLSLTLLCPAGGPRLACGGARLRHGAGVGGGGSAKPLPGRLCGEPEQVSAQAGHMGG